MKLHDKKYKQKKLTPIINPYIFCIKWDSMKRQSPCRTNPHGICHVWTIVTNELDPAPPMTKMTKMIKNRFLGILGILIIGVEP